MGLGAATNLDQVSVSHLVWRAVLTNPFILTVYFACCSPLENQSYSNNPSVNMGRANPVLPRPLQDRLEKIGLISQEADPIKSSQAIDLKKQQVRNVVSFALPSFGQPRKASLTGKTCTCSLFVTGTIIASFLTSNCAIQ